MVIGALSIRRVIPWVPVIVLTAILLMPRASADDQITKKDGSVVAGQIVSVDTTQVMVQSRTSSGGVAKFPVMLSDIKSINMAIPPAVTAAEASGVPSVDVIKALAGPVKQYAGLPVDWVVQAMAKLASAEADAGQPAQALAIYNQIIQLYPGSAYLTVAESGKADMSLKAGKIDEALATVQPIVDQANKNIAPSPSEGALYANAFLVYGQALEAKKQPQQALEAYLTVVTMFYQNAGLAAQAEDLAKKLRAANPGVSVL